MNWRNRQRAARLLQASPAPWMTLPALVKEEQANTRTVRAIKQYLRDREQMEREAA